MSKLIFSPRYTDNSLIVDVQADASFKAWYQVESGIPLPADVSNEGGIYKFMSINLPKDMSLILTTQDNLSTRINCHIPLYIKRSDAIEVRFSHVDPFHIEDSQGITQNHGLFDGKAFFIELALWPGCSGKVIGQGFEQGVSVQ